MRPVPRYLFVVANKYRGTGLAYLANLAMTCDPSKLELLLPVSFTIDSNYAIFTNMIGHQLLQKQHNALLIRLVYV